MKFLKNKLAISTKTTEDIWPVRDSSEPQSLKKQLESKPELLSLAATFITTLSCFGIYMIQGIIIARILGTVGRGEFGTAIYFPRDILLYAGLLGGIEIVNAYAKRPGSTDVSLKYSAMRLGLVSGLITAVFAAVLATVSFTLLDDKSYLIPLCLLCCVFVPFEHVHLTISAVDRGKEAYRRYNFNRLFFAAAFPVIVLALFGFDELFPESKIAIYRGFNHLLGLSPLVLICLSFVLSRILGLIPTLRGMELWSAFRGRLETASKQDGDIPNWKRLLVEGRSYAMSMFASEIFERLDIFLIVALAAKDQIGCYMVAVPAAALLTIGPNALGVFTFNAGADSDRRVTLKQAWLVMVGTALFQILATLLFMVIIPYLIILLFTEKFADAIPFALWLLPACAIKGYLQAVDGYLKGRGKPMIGVWSRVISIFVMLAFVWFGYEKFGLVSIPMAACAGQFISMLIISSAVIRDVSHREASLGAV